MSRFDRQVALFGDEGQRRLRSADVLVVGASGLGSHVIQQLALLGVGGLGIVEPQELDETNRNRLVGARETDPIPGMRKVDIGERLVRAIDSSIRVRTLAGSVVTPEGLSLVESATHVFGCVDEDGPRLFLTQACAAFGIPYIDLATDTESKDGKLRYGGRCFVSWDGQGCLVCCEVLNPDEASEELRPGAVKDRERIYGVERQDLGETGPSVVSLNGVVASLGVTEFMVGVTGLRTPRRHLEYRGEAGTVRASVDEPRPDCFYCGSRGNRDVSLLRTYFG